MFLYGKCFCFLFKQTFSKQMSQRSYLIFKNHYFCHSHLDLQSTWNWFLYIKYLLYFRVLKVRDQDFILPYKYQIDSAHWIMDWSGIQKGIFSLTTLECKLWYIFNISIHMVVFLHSNLCPWHIHPFLEQWHHVIMINAFWKLLISGSVSPTTLFFFKVVLTTFVFLFFTSPLKVQN